MNRVRTCIRFAGICLFLAFLPVGWPSDAPEEDPSRSFQEQQDSRGWWSLRPLERPSVPGGFTGGGANPIDAFIQARLAKEGLRPSPEADRRTLIRRLYFDVTGLPPTPEEVRRFRADRDPLAWENLIERLLSSPRYGERWARHWLDVARFAETHGFEMNQPRPNAWPYRDYVIRAFNEDKPYDRFVLEQIAGDILSCDEGTGFLVGGPWDQVKSPDPVLTANQRANELHDMISTTSSTFLGLTVGCARCHDHKFDPVPQEDYYRMKAVFEGVRHGERELRREGSAGREREANELRERLAEIEESLDRLEPLARTEYSEEIPPRVAVNARRNVERFEAVTADRLRFTIFKTTDAEPCIDELEVYTRDGRNVALAAEGATAAASSVYPNSEIHRLEHVHDGRHGNGRSWISNEPGAGWVELRFPAPVKVERVVWGRDREERYADRLAVEYRVEIAVSEGAWQVVAGSIDRAPYEKKQNELASLARMNEEEAARAKDLLAEWARHSGRLEELATVAMVYSGSFEAEPEPTHRLHRGDPMLKREPISPGALSVVDLPFETDAVFGGKQLSDDQRRRLALAKWMIHPENPLPARVMVNRIWQYHFGEGLVSTPSDFGANGAAPSHPELLDWLAAEFIESGWSIKHVHRLILSSGTYRQSSAARTEGLEVDADARLLWRYPPKRLEAEAIRDSILAASGKLDLRMGGPGFSFFEANDNYVRVYTSRDDWSGESFRRMVYGTVVRQRPDGVFGVFDCPDGGQIAPKRTSSTTPLQALNLLNSTFMMQQSKFFAERVADEAGENPLAQARRAFRLAFQREPDEEEAAAAAELVKSHGLPLLCRALLNASEFIYVF